MNEIDVVIPMVFPQDKEWQQSYNKYHGGAAATTHVRWRSWETEELLIKCVQKYMPWVRCIHILLAQESQKQPWMMNHGDRFPDSALNHKPVPMIHFHREFMPTEYLPCFSSPCFEMFLHRIPGLSEQFIYANDDMFPLSPMQKEDFFRDGKPCNHFMEKPFPVNPNIFHRKCRNQQNMIGVPFGKHFTKTWMKSTHSFAPILKSSCEEVWRRHGEEITKHLSPTKRTDYSYNHYIYMLYQLFAGIAIDYAPREQYVGSGTPTCRIADIIRDSQAGIVCLNDNEGIQDWKERAEIVRREIAAKLRIKN